MAVDVCNFSILALKKPANSVMDEIKAMSEYASMGIPVMITSDTSLAALGYFGYHKGCQQERVTMPIKTIRKFIRYEASAGIILFFTAVLAMVIDNSVWSHGYQKLLEIPLRVPLLVTTIDKPLLLWINDGLMAIFFLLVGLEIKREMVFGELSSWRKALLPLVAAIGGMIVPAWIYFGFTHHSPQLMHGWAIPVATDIAFSLGVLTLLGSRIPSALKVFLTAVAIFDDIGAVIIIAVFYTASLSLLVLVGALTASLVLVALNRLRVQQSWPYILFGIILWVCVLKSGVHATLAGIVLAFAIPTQKPDGKEMHMLECWERALHPWVAYLILPVFALANAGINFSGFSVNTLWHELTLACALGLFVGKQVGIVGSVWLANKMRLMPLPESFCLKGVWGISLIAGIGFTMSLFISSLAFSSSNALIMDQAQLGILLGSLVSGVAGYYCLKNTYPLSK